MSGGSLVYIVVTEDWSEPDGTDTPTGDVEFCLTAMLTSPGYVSPKLVQSFLSQGQIAQQLVATDFDSAGAPLVPSTVQYRVVERVLGSAEQSYYITVPAAPPGSRSVTDGVVVASSQLVTSASADFTDDDENAYLFFVGGQFPVGVQITEVVDDHTVQLNRSPGVSATGVHFIIGASASLSGLRPT